jgi:hypothetical protein
MQEITDSGASSTPKCSDTTEESIKSTLSETTKKRGNSGTRTKSKRHASGMSDSKEKSEGPPPRILVNELNRWTFRYGETKYQADDTEHMFAWMYFVGKWANIKGKVDWEDLEERAHFLNMLYVWCEKNNEVFPLEEINSALNFSGNETASEASQA